MFGGPRMILHANWKILFQKRGLAFYYPPRPPRVWQKTTLFPDFVLCNLPLCKLFENTFENTHWRKVEQMQWRIHWRLNSQQDLNFKYKTLGTDDVDFWIVLYFWIRCVVVAIFWKFLLRDPDIFFQMFLDKSSEHFRISVPVQRFPKMLPKNYSLFLTFLLVWIPMWDARELE